MADTKKTKVAQPKLLSAQEKAIKRALPPKKFSPPADTAPEVKPVASASIAVTSEADHEAQFPRTEVFQVRNHTQSTMTINMCAGKHVRMWRKEGARLMVNKDMPQACKSCPGRELHLLSGENKQVQTVLKDCFRSEQVVGLLQAPTRQLSIKHLEKGPADRIKKTALTVADLT